MDDNYQARKPGIDISSTLKIQKIRAGSKDNILALLYST